MGKRIAVFGPTSAYLTQAMDEITRYLEGYDTPGITYGAHDGAAAIEHRDGGWIRFFAADGHSYRPVAADVLYVDAPVSLVHPGVAELVAASPSAEVIYS
ncbi:hypothetical protein LTT66_18255 [Nocardia gipuzkoensis]|uniref:hypothetical protein n=1 Tax=Nocardia gipuzkoensis TaxID=2749991 RepID=UPI001E6454CA|nr:hypothetical protein [Nocardia gipuzkoensis]UGT65313.1 hypothetical protein LTT66_18255 [Nocardia gipuzkoensis]